MMPMYVEGVPGIGTYCVYWIGGNGKDQGMVFDMETRRSTSFGTPKSSLYLGIRIVQSTGTS